MDSVKYFNYIIAVLFTVCYSYQFFYVFVSLVASKRRFAEAAPKKYAVLISARNEASVIAQLIGSIKGQDYPTELVDIYVVADNCIDATAFVAREAGATVYERFDMTRVGKGYALSYLLDRIHSDFPDNGYDGFFVFDADNLLDEGYIREMNKTFSAGYRVVTSYRNSKNYDSNWLSAGYSLWFLREARYLNNSRMILGTSCAVSGTGFLVHRDIIERNHGWKHFLLTEDIEFTVDNILNGERIGYCADAVLYDEQPVTFTQSYHQRLRWAKGYLQVFRRYGSKLVKGMFSKKFLPCFDMTMAIMPAILLTVLSLIINITAFFMGSLVKDLSIMVLLGSIGESLLNAYLLLFAMGLITTVTEWKSIHCSAGKKLAYMFTFPLFLLTYIPISFVALFKRVEWKPIRHSISKNLEQVRLAK